MAIGSPRKVDSQGFPVVFSGVLHKKRGGFGRRSASPYVPRYFELGADGVLGYYDGTKKTGAPRGTLNLLSARATLAVVQTDPAGGAPAPTALAISHEEGSRWKLCAPGDGKSRDAWRDALAPYCRSAAAPGTRPARATSAPPPDLPSDLAAQRRRRFERPAPNPATDDAGAEYVRFLATCFVVSAAAAISCRSAFAVAVLALLHGYALLALARGGRLDAPRPTRVVSDDDDAALLKAPRPPLPASALEADGDDATKPRAGAVLREVPFDENGGAPAGTWSKCAASTFKVRQVGYKQTKRKAPSAEGFYEAVTVDMFDAGARVAEMGSLLELPPPARVSPDSDVPALFVVVAQVPSETGPLKAKHDADGHGYQMAICFQLTARTASELQCLKDAPDALSAERRAALKLLKRYCRVAPGEPQLGAAERGRFKVLAQIRNIDEVAIPAFAKGYNGKPALINKTGVLTRCGPDDAYLNMDVNIHGFGYMARSGLQSIFRDFQDFILSIGFTVESRADDELPECMLGCFDLNHVDYNAAVPWD